MIAPYGTKVVALTRSEPICLDLTQSDDGGQMSGPSESAIAGCDTEHAAWWSQIRAGSLVDAKDLQGVWYQVHEQRVFSYSILPLMPLIGQNRTKQNFEKVF